MSNSVARGNAFSCNTFVIIYLPHLFIDIIIYSHNYLYTLLFYLFNYLDEYLVYTVTPVIIMRYSSAVVLRIVLNMILFHAARNSLSLNYNNKDEKNEQNEHIWTHYYAHSSCFNVFNLNSFNFE